MQMIDFRGNSSEKKVLKIVSIVSYILIGLIFIIMLSKGINSTSNQQIEEQPKHNNSIDVNETVRFKDKNIWMTINKYSIIEDCFVINATFENKGSSYEALNSLGYALNENGSKADSDGGIKHITPRAITDELYVGGLQPKEKNTGSIVFYLEDSFKQLDVYIGGLTLNVRGLEYKRSEKIENPQKVQYKGDDGFSQQFYLAVYLITFGISLISIKRSKSLTYMEQTGLIMLSMVLCFIPMVSLFWAVGHFKIKSNKNGIKIIINANEELTRNLTEETVKEYLNIIRKIKISRKPDAWDGLRNGFLLVNESENISSDLKKEFKNMLVEKNMYINDLKFKDSEEVVEKKKRESGEQGEKDLKYKLSGLDKEYKVLYNVQIAQKIDALAIGPNGVFHLEVKNYGGERGWNIVINDNGEWVKNYNGNITAVESPSFQVRRHQKVLRQTLSEILWDKKVNLVGIIVMTNKNTNITGASNNSVPVIKIETVVEFIEEYKSNERLTKEEINNIYMELRNHSVEQ